MSTTKLSSALMSGVSIAACLSLAPAVSAQDTSDNTLTLEEITVTAQKREQSAQDVPIALNAFSGNFLETVAAEDLRDITAYTPGLEVSGVTQPRFKIRGIETSDFGVGTDPAVGVFVDGVYASRSGAGIVFFSDLERVEVLKGPQGTLFGRNTAAGAISIITNKPDMDEFSARVNLRYGRFDKQRIDAMINAPLTDTVAMRANFLVNDQDGYATDALTGDDYGREHNVTGRVQVRWEPSDRTALNLAFEFDHTKQDEDQPVVGVSDGSLDFAPGAETLNDMPGHVDFLHAVLGPSFGGLTREQFGALPIAALTGGVPLQAFYANFTPAGYVPASSGDWSVFRDGNSIGGADPYGPFSSDVRNGEENRDLDGVTLTITHDFDWATLTSISAFKRFTSNNLEEEDGTADPDFYFDSNNIEENEHIYQELRLNGQSGDLTWTIGGSYYWENAKQNTVVNATMNSIDTALYNLGATPGILVANGFNPLDGINGCESLFLDTMNSFVGLTTVPLGCMDPSAVGTPLEGLSLEDVSNMALQSFDGRLWTEHMYGEGTFKAFAAFADATYAVTDRLNLTAGIRYTHDKKSWLWRTDPREIEGSDLLEIPGVGNLADIHQAILQAVVGGSGDIVYNLPICADASTQVCEGRDFERSQSWNNVSPRVAVDYRVSDDAMVYASYARGYKAGGFNSQEVNSEFDNESVWNVEVGLKSQWFDDRVRFNASVWKYKYNDKQAIRLASFESGSVPRYVTETSDTEGKGVDIELLWAPAPGLRLFANGGYQDVTCTENCGISEVGEPTGAPKARVSFGGDYSFGLGGDNGSINLHLDHSYTSKERLNGQCLSEGTCGTIVWGNGSWETGKARNLTNVRMGWTNADEDLSISLFVTNLFANRYLGGATGVTAETFGTPISERETPSLWGIDLTKRF
ncbi:MULTISPECIES: TonB-dependent receptor [Kordiimonas]|uniref:TonB-dependent receptor n=1 Tax=Kordiimonas TaxID=288021 RepID=UPI00257FC708|nr:TonB-dependent receptor [Kordiimonas sp. UBA4487]